MFVSWFSAGVSSFIATYLCKDKVDKIMYIHIEEQHEDTLRFVKDCEKILGKEIEILQSPYKSVENVINAFQFINSPYGAKCTDVLKKRVRKEWEYSHKDEEITYIWGYDSSEQHRAERLLESMPEYSHIFPLIERSLSKDDVHQLSKTLDVKRPAMYDLGYRNNNCIGCVKGGMGYWNKIRKDFPEHFEKRAKQERQIGKSCLKEIVNGKTQQLFLDELDPARGNFESEIMEECGIICMMYQNELRR